MGLFGKKKENPMEVIMKKVFPNGKSDITAGTEELLSILGNTVSVENARNIFTKSMAIAFLSNEFDINRLEGHLNGYCKGIFSSSELQQFHSYLTARKVALMMGVSKVKKDAAGNYNW